MCSSLFRVLARPTASLAISLCLHLHLRVRGARNAARKDQNLLPAALVFSRITVSGIGADYFKDQGTYMVSRFKFQAF